MPSQVYVQVEAWLRTEMDVHYGQSLPICKSDSIQLILDPAPQDIRRH